MSIVVRSKRWHLAGSLIIQCGPWSLNSKLRLELTLAFLDL